MQNKPSFYQCAEKYSSTQVMLGGKCANNPEIEESYPQSSKLS